jgi:acyl-CoA synthetase (NDP forming)
MMYELREFGFSTAIGIGGDPVIGTTHIDALEAFEADPETDAIVMIGEIGGDAEERAADFIEANVTKPVVGYVAGFTAPEGKTMGHAGAIVSGSSGTAQAKQEALEAAGVKVGKTPSATAALMRSIMRSARTPRSSPAGRPGSSTSRAAWTQLAASARRTSSASPTVAARSRGDVDLPAASRHGSRTKGATVGRR